MIAREAQHGHAQRAEHIAEMDITGGVVLDEVARDQHRIGRPVMRLCVRQRGLERGQSGDSTQRFRFAAVEVRVREVCQTQYAHDPAAVREL